MIHKAWSSIEEVPYCFWRSSVKFQGHTALKILKFDPNWVFPDCNSSLNSSMAMKCCTKLETAKERCPIVFQGHPSNFKVTRYKTSPILTQIGHFRTVGRSQLSNPSDLPCSRILTMQNCWCFLPTKHGFDACLAFTRFINLMFIVSIPLPYVISRDIIPCCKGICLYHAFAVSHCRADSRFAPNQWQTSLQSNAISHWLDANLESALQWHWPDWLSRLCDLRSDRRGQWSSSVAGSWQPNNNFSLHIGGSGNHIKTAPYIGFYFLQWPWAYNS